MPAFFCLNNLSLMAIAKHLTRHQRWIVLFLIFLLVSVGTVSTFNRIKANEPIELSATSIPVPENFFGMHIHHLVKTPYPDMPPTPWPAVPFATWRLWDAYVSWPNLEPRQGKWNFETLDEYVALAEEKKVELLLVLGLSPHWASARPTEKSTYGSGNAAEPKNLEYWSDYVRTVATRYKGRIRYYEIWNEPNLPGFYTGTVAEMLRLSQKAYQILKEVDPSITVVSPSAAHSGDSGLTWLEEYLSRGGGSCADVIGYHFYVKPEPPEAMETAISQVRELMAKYEINKTLWNTEAGWSKPKPFPSEELAAAYVARSYILNWAGGVSRFYWYAWDNQNWVSLPMVEADRTTLTPAAVAYANVQKWLVGAQMSPCQSNSQNTWICQLKRDRGYQGWIVWNPDGKLRFNVPDRWRVKQIRDLAGTERDLSGNSIEIGPSPLLLEK